MGINMQAKPVRISIHFETGRDKMERAIAVAIHAALKDNPHLVLVDEVTATNGPNITEVSALLRVKED